jgi:hypothetical protein
MPVLAGAFLGAIIFEPLVGSSLLDSLVYASIEVLVTFAGGMVAAQLSPPPLRFTSPRDVGAVVAGAVVLALTGAVIVGLWGDLGGRLEAWRTFRVWLVGNFVGMLLIAPFVASWAQFRPKRSGGLTMSSFAGGAVACALFLICLYVLFSAHPEGSLLHSFAIGFTYLPFVFFRPGRAAVGHPRRDAGGADRRAHHDRANRSRPRPLHSIATGSSATPRSTRRATRPRSRSPVCWWRHSWRASVWRRREHANGRLASRPRSARMD